MTYKSLALYLAILLVGCNNQDSNTTQVTPPIEKKKEEIFITSEKTTYSKNEKITLNTTEKTNDITWFFSNPSLLSKNTDGSYSANQIGSTEVYAKKGDTKSNSIQISINELVTSKTSSTLTFNLDIEKPSNTEINLVDSKPVTYSNIHLFSDIYFTRDGEKVYLVNNTLGPINTFYVSTSESNGGKRYSKLTLNSALDAKHVAEVEGAVFLEVFAKGNLPNIHLQNSLFSPRLTIGPENQNAQVSDYCSDISVRCYRPVLGDEINDYAVMAVNIKNIFNRKSFLDTAREYLKSHCSGFPDCVNYTGQLDHDLYTYLTMSTKTQNVIWQVFGNVYGAPQGLGVGYKPTLMKTYNDSYCLFNVRSCWASVQDRFVDKTSSFYKDLNFTLYNYILHETAHAYDLNHESGWAYGISDELENYLRDYLSTEKAQSLNNIEVAKHLIQVKEVSDKKIKFNILSENDALAEVKLMLISEAPVTYSADLDVMGNITLSLSEALTAPLYLIASVGDDDFLTTLRFNNEGIGLQKNTFTIGNQTFYVMNNDNEETQHLTPPQFFQKCLIGGGRPAYKSDVFKLYDFVKANFQSSAPISYNTIIAADGPSNNRFHYMQISDSGIDYHHYWTNSKIGADKSIICIQESDVVSLSNTQ
ncbi:hypothetical protein [Enterovibrio coralii]|uniref:BIG2 domain-containing protein n=1 Tax=Enterovibrio coralii TaxID=294935 RepID=A0A135I9C3_9GAMM|nr:hypothetical protein [Enterovibrio coralii]KXF82049.1 hypothetical protein ATN88_19750 [Enterovibrio coralii]